MSFFFQAEDGIRDDLVTGVQTCALPICIVKINEHFRNSPRQLRTDIDADNGLDGAAGLHQGRDTAAFDRGGEEGLGRASLAVCVAKARSQRAQQNGRRGESHGVSPPIVPEHGALSTLCSVASRLESVTEPRALQGYGICAQATSYWATAAVEFALPADAVFIFPA